MNARSSRASLTIAVCAVVSIVLKQDGEKITGTYHGMYGPAEVTGTIKSNDVTLTVTVHGSTAHFSGKMSSATKMSGTVTGTSDAPRQWSAEKDEEKMMRWRAFDD
jgi:hypothetical protein